jgi:streptogramin lyase
MSRYGFHCRVALVVLALLVSVASRATAEEASFQAVGNAAVVAHDGKWSLVAFEGLARHLGPCTGTVRVWWRSPQLQQATMTLEGAGGDVIDFYIETAVDETTGDGLGSYVIVGGSGRFNNAAGSGTFRAAHNPDGTLWITLDGTISY